MTASRRAEADPEDAAASAHSLQARLRDGTLSANRVRAAAWCGHPSASQLFPHGPRAEGRELPGLELLPPSAQRPLARSAAAAIFETLTAIPEPEWRAGVAVAARVAAGEASAAALAGAREQLDLGPVPPRDGPVWQRREVALAALSFAAEARELAEASSREALERLWAAIDAMADRISWAIAGGLLDPEGREARWDALRRELADGLLSPDGRP